MRLTRAGKAAWCPPERRDIMPEALRTLGTRRAIILLGVSSLALLFLASALLPTEASAQTTSPEGKIVFVRPGPDPSEHCFGQACSDIWVMDADGSSQTNLTKTPDTPDADNFHEYQPSWSPSGTQIVFVREIPGQVFSEQPDVFVMDTDPTTDDAINLTDTDASESDPAWSPDGTKIALAGVRNQGWEIVTMDTNGQNEAILTGDSFEGDDHAPDWSPDSTKVVFMKQSQVGGCCEPWEIWGVNSDGRGDTNLTNNPADDMGPSWSPDGTEITFSSNRDATVEDPFRTDIYAMA